MIEDMHPICYERMRNGRCPYCGLLPGAHAVELLAHEAPGRCDFLPAKVAAEIDRYRDDAGVSR